jgi:SAM-dependent methyltransferase
LPSDSSKPEFWDTRFRDGVTPWDAGGAPAHLRDWISGKKPCRVLVPGAGSGYEVRLFTGLGHDVLAIDFSDAAIEAARQLGVSVKKADFFGLRDGPFDLIYERAFLCALPRTRWPEWGRRMAELVRPGGELAGFFYIDDNQRGPPFGTSHEGLAGLRAEAFELKENQAVPAEQSIPVFQGREIWQVWKRRL